MFVARGNEQMGEWKAAGLKCGKNDKYNSWMKSFWKKNSLLFLFTRVDFIKMNLIKDPLTRKKSCDDLMKIFVEYDKMLKNSGRGGLCLTAVEKQPDIYAHFLIDEAWNNALRAYMAAIFEGLRFPKLKIASRPRFNIHADDQGKCMFYKKYPSPNFLKYTNFCHPLTTLKFLIPIMRCCSRYVLPFGWKKRLDRIKALMDGKMNISVMLKKTGMNGENPLKNMMTMIHSHFHYLMAKRMGATPAVKKNHIKNIFPAKNIIY